MSSACNCCSEPPCAAPVLEFISVTGDTTCGWIAGEGDSFNMSDYGSGGTVGLPDPEFRKRYHKVTVTRTASFSDGGGPGYGFDDYSEAATTTEITVWTRSEVGGVCTSGAVTGSYVFSRTVTGSYDPTPEGDYLLNQAEAGSYTMVAGAWSGSGTITATYSVSGDDVGSTGRLTFLGTCAVTPCASSWSGATWTRVLDNGTEVVAYSDEVLPVYPAWPAWLGESADPLLTGQGYLTQAVNSLASQTKVKWRMNHSPTGTCYLKAWLQKTFTPTTGAVVVTPLATYEWTGTGNPCVASPDLGVSADGNKIKGSATDEPAPSVPGVTTFQVVKYSCVPGYEPDISDPENPQPNGYPDPAWEASPP